MWRAHRVISSVLVLLAVAFAIFATVAIGAFGHPGLWVVVGVGGSLLAAVFVLIAIVVHTAARPAQPRAQQRSSRHERIADPHPVQRHAA
jgi:membrane protein implicated in regulation of membrane protease activity